MINEAAYITIRNGRVGIVSNLSNSPGVLRKSSPEPVQSLPSSSSHIAHTSVLSNLNVDRLSLAFQSHTFHTALVPIDNFNSNGQLNA
jgi:hypothetical protein